MVAPPTSSSRRGVLFMLTSSAAFGLSGTLATSLLRAGWSTGAAVLVRLTVASLVLAVPALLSLRGQLRRLVRNAGSLLWYGLIAVAASQVCYFEAVAHLSVAVALLLEYSGIVLVVGWTWAVHRQRPGALTAGGGLLTLAGLSLVLGLAHAQRLDLAGVLWGLGAAVGLAAYFLIAARRSGDELTPLAVAWGGLAIGALVIGLAAALHVVPFRLSGADVVLAHHRVGWFVPALGLGVVAGAFAYVTGIAGTRRLGARLASFLGLAEVLGAVVAAWLLLGQSMSGRQLGGGALVLGGIALVRLEQSRNDGEPASSPVSAAPVSAAPVSAAAVSAAAVSAVADEGGPLRRRSAAAVRVDLGDLHARAGSGLAAGGARLGPGDGLVGTGPVAAVR